MSSDQDTKEGRPGPPLLWEYCQQADPGERKRLEALLSSEAMTDYWPALEKLLEPKPGWVEFWKRLEFERRRAEAEVRKRKSESKQIRVSASKKPVLNLTLNSALTQALNETDRKRPFDARLADAYERLRVRPPKSSPAKKTDLGESNESVLAAVSKGVDKLLAEIPTEPEVTVQDIVRWMNGGIATSGGDNEFEGILIEDLLLAFQVYYPMLVFDAVRGAQRTIRNRSRRLRVRGDHNEEKFFILGLDRWFDRECRRAPTMISAAIARSFFPATTDHDELKSKAITWTNRDRKAKAGVKKKQPLAGSRKKTKYTR